MFTLALRYLNGWAMASDPANYERPEWPPHPDRVFMALAAAHFETDGADEEAEALRWLERQPSPALAVSDYHPRASTVSYVPVNDTQAPRIRGGAEPSTAQLATALSLLPENRSRQARRFPVAVPIDPVVHFIWSTAPPPAVASSLNTLCDKLVRVGHSASLVQAWVEDNPPAPNLEPTRGLAKVRLRISGRGRLEYLTQQYEFGRRPASSLWAGYAPPADEPPVPVPISSFDSRLLVLRRVAGRRLGLESTLLLTETLRNAVLSRYRDPAPEWISGHSPDGRPTREPHVAFIPLADVGFEHSDGHLMGAALVVPRDLSQAEVGRGLNAMIGFDESGTLRQLQVYAGDRFEWTLELERREAPPVALRSEIWTSPSRQWASVTPVVFDRHPKGKRKDREVEAMVADACGRIGLPRPAAVVLSEVSLHVGVAHARSFPAFRRKSDGGRMQHRHVVLTFEEPVGGPVLLGAGRFRGYGLCRPVRR